MIYKIVFVINQCQFQKVNLINHQNLSFDLSRLIFCHLVYLLSNSKVAFLFSEILAKSNSIFKCVNIRRQNIT